MVGLRKRVATLELAVADIRRDIERLEIAISAVDGVSGLSATAKLARAAMFAQMGAAVERWRVEAGGKLNIPRLKARIQGELVPMARDYNQYLKYPVATAAIEQDDQDPERVLIILLDSLGRPVY